MLFSLRYWNSIKHVSYYRSLQKTVNIPPLLKRSLFFSPAAEFFGQNRRKICDMVGNTGADFFARYSYNSPKTKYNGYIVTISNGLSRIVMRYLGIKVHKHEIFLLFCQSLTVPRACNKEIFENHIQFG
jgi:hypothetical protein